jgi:lactobin A/cerein 7B family class IIb bacteriocin
MKTNSKNLEKKYPLIIALTEYELKEVNGGGMNIWKAIGFIAQSLAIGAENCGSHGQHVYFQ